MMISACRHMCGISQYIQSNFVPWHILLIALINILFYCSHSFSDTMGCANVSLLRRFLGNDKRTLEVLEHHNHGNPQIYCSTQEKFNDFGNS